MARQIVNIGSTANDRTGDSLRDGGQKINGNFQELYSLLGDSSVVTTYIGLTNDGVVFKGATYNTTLDAVEGGADLTISLPNSDGTIITTTATQTLTNKTLVRPVLDSATLNIISISDLDNSHKYTLQPSNLTSDRSITIPTISSDDTFVLRTTTQTLTNKTLASPRVTTGIFDANGAELIRSSATLTAVNDITVANAATGSRPVISATGDDTNISLGLTSKGTGAIVLSKVAFTSKTISAGDSDTTTNTVIVGNPSTSLTISLDNGTVDGENKILVNRGTGTFTVNQTGSNFQFPGGATSITLNPNGAAQLIWIGGISKWFMIGSPDSADALISIS